MDTPAASGQDAFPPIYGEGGRSINRRLLIMGAGALAMCPAAARRRADPVATLLAAVGGSPTLQRVRAIAWSGTLHRSSAVAHDDLGVDARIIPFESTRWTSWPLEDGRASATTLAVERDYGFEVMGGAQRALPPDRLTAMRQQFALYGYMVLAGASLSRDGAKVRAERPGFPPMLFTAGRHGMGRADYFATFGDGPPAPAHLAFDGVIEDHGVRWPRHIVITSRKTTRLALTIDDFSVDLAPA